MGLGIHFGSPGAKVFKPVISSQGEHNLMYGKTEFVYDPKMDKFFNANPNLDILMAASAEKLKIYQERDLNNVAREMLQIPRENFYNTRAVDPAKIIDIPLNAVGIQKIPDHFTPAKISPSVINNHTDVDLARKLYRDYYAEDIATNMKRISDILANPFIEYELMKQIKSGQTSERLEDIELMDSYSFNQSLQLEWLKSSEYASIDVFGPGAKMNPLKARFLDQAMAPSSEYKINNKLYRFGGKATLMQTMDTNLQGTKFNPET